MKGLTLTNKEQARVQVLNEVLEGKVNVSQASGLMGVSERHGWLSRLTTQNRVCPQEPLRYARPTHWSKVAQVMCIPHQLRPKSQAHLLEESNLQSKVQVDRTCKTHHVFGL